MRTPLPLLAIGALACTTHVAPAVAQYRCDASTQSEWLRATPAEVGFQADWSAEQIAAWEATWADVPRERILPVDKFIEEATARLARTSVVPLTDRQFGRYSNRDGPTDPAGLRPYLVRAVYPTGNPSLDVSWHGEDIFVTAFGLGCFPYLKRPIIVFLEKEPEQVFVTASAAL